LFGYRALPEHPLVVLVGLSKDSVLAPWRQGATVAGLATASAVGLSVFLWWLALHYARREAEAQAASAQTAKLEAIGRTTSGVAHDFNNILTAMGGALRLLGKRLTDDQHAAKIVDQGLISVEQGRNLVAQLLNVTRQDVTVEELDINTVLRSMTTLLSSVASPRARVHIDLAIDLHHCRIDSSRLGAAVLNLVMNACDAMPKDREAAGLIVISSSNSGSQPSDVGASEEASFVSVTVRDNGAGMDPKVLKRALEPFFTTKGKNGTGLGLSQVHTFVQDMGGSLEIESEEGKGTAVHLRFPRADRSSSAEPGDFG
jgi:signal transduction histidine kinase